MNTTSDIAADVANPNEAAYLALLRDVREHGRRGPTRAVLGSTGEGVDALGVFGRQVRYDLAAGFPAVTTKRLNWDAVVHEMVWFLSGSTNVKYLREHGIRIWDPWAGPDGEVGPIYGYQWRRWRALRRTVRNLGTMAEWSEYHTGRIDQVAALIDGIARVRDDPACPAARRLILSAWNVADLGSMALPPCHVLAQFHVDHDAGTLSCQSYQRSADLFLGVPFNVASYALLTHLLAHLAGLRAGELIHAIGDAHIYANHLDAVDEQLGRVPFPAPTLCLADGEYSAIDDFRREHVELVDYRHHPALRGEVAI